MRSLGSVVITALFVNAGSMESLAQSGLANSSWPQYRFDGHLTAHATVAGPSEAQIKWQTPIGSGQLGSPVVGPDGTIYVPGKAEGDENFYALNPDGSIKWIFTVAGGRFVAAAVVGADGTIYIGNTKKDTLYALNPDKSIKWAKRINGVGHYPANIGPDGIIYVPTQRGFIFAVRPQDAERRWHHNLHAIPPNSPALGIGDTVYAVAGDKIDKLFSLPEPGTYTLKWTGRYDAIDSLEGLAIDEDGILYATAPHCAIVLAIDPRKGEEKWRYKLPHGYDYPSIPAFGNNGTLCFTTTKNGGIIWLNKSDGSERTVLSVPGGNFVTAPIVDVDGNAYAVHSGKGLVSVTESGVRWSESEANGTAQLAIGQDGTIYVAGDEEVVAVGQSNPVLTVDPDSLEFGQVCLDSLKTIDVMIGNSGGDTLKVTGIEAPAPPFFVDLPSPSISVPPGGTITLRVRFAPTAAGKYEDSMTIRSNGGDATVALAGEGVQAQIELISDPPTFGEVCKGERAAIDVIVYNPSNCTLRIDSVLVIFTRAAGEEPNLGIASATPPPPILVPPGGTYSFEVASTRRSLGDYEAKITVWSNAVPSPIELVATGTVIPPQIDGVKSVEFGDVVRNQTKTDTARVWNAGTCPITIESIRIEGSPAFTTCSTPPTSIAVGETVGICVAFTPTTDGPHTGRLFVFNDDPDSNPLIIELNGNGVAPDPIIVVVPDTLRYGPVCKGSTAIDSVTVRNIGFGDLQVFGISLNCGAFMLDATNLVFPFTLTSGQERVVRVIYAPAEVSTPSCSLIVSSNATREDSVAVLIGEGIGPTIALIATLDSLGRVCLGSVAASKICIQNTSACTLRVKEIIPEIIEPGATRPISSRRSSEIIIPPGEQNCTFSVGAQIKQIGPFEIRVTVISDAVNEDTVIVSIPGLGVGPDIDGLTGMEFDTVEVQLCSGNRNFAESEYTIHNPSSCALLINNLLATGDFAVVSPAVPFTIPGGDSATITLRFEPKTTGPHSGTLRILSNDPDEPEFPVALHGVGISAPDIAADPSALNFGDVTKGETKTLFVSISNQGADVLNVTSFVVTNPVFSVVAGAFSLTCDADSAIAVTFSPSADTSYAGELLVYSNDPDEYPLVIPLNGNGTIAPPGEIGVSPLQIDFGAPCDSVTIMVIVSNTGQGPLTVDSLVFSNPAFSTSHAAPFEVEVGEDDTVWVTFHPIAGQSSNGTLAIHGDDPDEPVVEVALRGVGGAPDIGGADHVDFDTTSVGDSSREVYVLRNAGSCTLAVAGTNIEGSHPDDFHIIEGAEAFIAPGESDSLILEFAPSAPGERTALLVITNNDPDEPRFVVTLNGYAVGDTNLTASPNPLVFPNTCLGSTTERCITVTNAGNVPLTVNRIEVSGPPFFLPEPGTLELAPGASGEICVAFSPLDTIQSSAVLTIYSDVGFTATDTLVGRGVSPHVSGARSLVFAETGVGTQDTLTYTITGDTLCALRIDSLTITGGQASEFEVLPVPLPHEIAANDSLGLEIVFSPTAVGTRQDTLNVWSNDRRMNPFKVALEGIGAPGRLEPPPVAFDPICAGDVATIGYSLRNVGLGVLVITEIKRACETRERDECKDWFTITLPQQVTLPHVLRPGQVLQISLTFSRPDAGPATESLLVYTDAPAPDDVFTISLEGLARTPDATIVVSPPPEAFVGTLDDWTPCQPVLIMNDGCKPLDVTSRMFEGQTFRVCPGSMTSFTLAPGESREVMVQFRGTNFREFEDVLIVSNSDPKNPEVPVPLRGKVVDALGCLKINPSSLDFGEVIAGRKSDPKEIELTNCSQDARLKIESIPPKTTEFSWPAVKTTLLPDPGEDSDSKYIIFVTFTPRTNGEKLDTLVVLVGTLDGGWDTTVAIPLRGKGIGVDHVVVKPNAFTPNDDGMNDMAKFLFPDKLVKPTVHIFDLRGIPLIELKEATNNTIEWNGRDDSGHLQLPGAYLWIMEDQGKKIGSGQIVLIR